MMEQDDDGVTDRINRLVKLKQVANKPGVVPRASSNIHILPFFSFSLQAFC
jgi:hypothetical protein